MDIAGHGAHDDHFLGTYIGDDDAVTPNGDAAVAKIDGALDATVDKERFGAADLALDDDRASYGGLFHGRVYIFWWCVRVGIW